MQTNSPSLGQEIKRFRLINDIRQEDMAEKMGISRATLINYEKGHTVINIDVLNRLKSAYPNFQEKSKADSKPRIIVNNSLDFKTLFNVLKNDKKTIFIITFIIAFIGTSSSFMFKDFYRSEISLYPAKKSLPQGFNQLQNLAANFGMNTQNNDQSFNISDVVRSRLIASKAASQVWPTKENINVTLQEFWDINKKTIFSFNKAQTSDSLIIKEKIIRKFQDHISVKEDKMTGLIKISSTFEDPIVSANIANFLGEQVENYIQKENSAQTTKEKVFIAERLSIVKNELESSEKNLKEFKERNRGYEESPELFMIYSQFYREVEAKKEVYLTLQKQLELARIEEVKQSPVLHILDHAVPPIKKTFPNRRVFLLASIFIGLIFSSLISVFRY